eukprot:589103-Pleurochrysis_carterae.AAC.1
MQSPQPSIVTPALSPTPINHPPRVLPIQPLQLNRHLSINNRPSRNQPLQHPDRRLNAYVLLVMYLLVAD